MTELTVVVPVFNEALSLEVFHRRLAAAIDRLELVTAVIYVNDGSADTTGLVLDAIAKSDARVTIVELSRNFGHQAALSAGLERAEGRLIAMLDGDGQHPPELLPDMVRLQSIGYDIVQCQRIDAAESASFVKRTTAGLFYSLLKKIGEIELAPGSADFRLITAEVLDALRSLPEYHRFIRGMISWVGFRSLLLPYNPEARIGGKSNYSLGKMLRLARDGVFSFSLVPLRLGLLVGSTFFLLGVVEVIYVLSFWITGKQHMLVPGWSSIILLVTFATACIMVALGFIGVYVGMIFQEAKRRPVFIARSRPASISHSSESAGTK
jgi:dolichol-phosphate mannosyltransferase